RYLVAWRDTLEVWVDLNRNHDLRDDGGPVPNMNVRARAGQFPAPVSFTVAFGPNGLPHIYDRGWSAHETMVAGTAAGSHFLSSAVGGVAPGARLLPVLSQNDL